MILVKNKLIIFILFFSLALPLAGFGFIGSQNLTNRSGMSLENNFNLMYESSGNFESSFGFFIYIDLPKKLTLELSSHMSEQNLDINISMDNQSFNTNGESELFSQYLTLRKNYKNYSIPVLAKFTLNYGIGINTHQLSVPSISVLKDEYDTEDLNDIYDQISQNMYFDFPNPPLSSYLKYEGVHFQLGSQMKLLMMNLFATAKYTFLFTARNTHMKSFPSINIGIGWGI